MPRRVLRNINYLEEQNKQLPQSATYEYGVYNFRHDCIELLCGMYEVYSNTEISDTQDALQVLFCLKELVGNKPMSKLYYLDWENRAPIPVENYIPIGQGHLGKVFLKSLDVSLSMVEVARLGVFIIKYIEKEDLTDNESVGVGNEKPQIWFCPDNKKFYEVKGEELDKICEGIDGEVNTIIKQIGSLSSFLRS